MKKFIEEFKAFIAKGNVIDMAVAVVIGTAFNKIVSSLVNDVIMPLVGLLVGKMNVAELKWVITPAVLDETGTVVTAETALRYGSFIQTIIDFLIIAMSIFIMLKIVLGAKEKLHFTKKAEEAAEAEAEEVAETESSPSAEELLTEIRDLLAKDK